MIKSPEENSLIIEEENYKMLWAAGSLASFMACGLMLDDLQNSGTWWEGKILLVLIGTLFTIGIWSLVQVFKDLYSIILEVESETLIIKTFKREELVHERRIEMKQIDKISFYPTDPPKPWEALYDYSTSYQIVYKPRNAQHYKPLIDLRPDQFTLKIDDIGRIVNFLQQFRPSISVPEHHKTILGVN